MTMSDEQVKVIQADREAAAEFGRTVSHRMTPSDARNVLAGKWDGTEDVLAFARHRLSHLPQGGGEVREALRVAIEVIEQAPEDCMGGHCNAETGDLEYWHRDEWLSNAKAALSPHPVSSVSREDVLETALLSVVDAVRDYLPPDGINRDQFINRVIAATDNPTINPVIAEIENGRA